MRLATIHAILLLLALGLAYQTWTRETIAAGAPGSVLLWSANRDDLVAMRYQGDQITVEVERRRDEYGVYYWGRASYPRFETAAGDLQPGGTSEPVPVQAEFLVGGDGSRILDSAVRLRAWRDLGILGEQREREYGLDETSGRFVVDLGGTTRELLIGDAVWGTGARYAKDPQSGRIYVLDPEFVVDLEGGERTMAEYRLHDFQYDRVARVTVRTAGGERTMVRGEYVPFRQVDWSPEDRPDQPDQLFSEIMERIRHTSVVSYQSGEHLDAMTPVARIEYFGPAGDQVGFLDLRSRPNQAGGVEYMALTELSRVPVRLYEIVGQQLETDLERLF